MATFDVEQAESMRWVRIDLADDDCRTERGALNHMKGAITMSVPLPTLRSLWVSLFSDESILRPRYEAPAASTSTRPSAAITFFPSHPASGGSSTLAASGPATARSAWRSIASGC